MTGNLKPCPFCHGTNVRALGSMYAYVRCSDCECIGPNVRPKNDDPSKADLEEAERLWNER